MNEHILKNKTLEKENAELKKHIDEIKKYKICPRCTRSDVQKLEKENAELKAKLNGALDICNIPEFRINDLEKENEQLKCDLYNTEANLQGMTINCEKLENKNTELKEQIEKMKCCGNCKHLTRKLLNCENIQICKVNPNNIYGVCDIWELLE